MSAQLKERLIPAVWDQLKSATSSTTRNIPPSSSADNTQPSLPAVQVAEAVRKAFITLDKQIVDTAAESLKSDKPFSTIFSGLKVATAGSCALLALYDPLAQLLHVACTGDSRAVLGAPLTPTGPWIALRLSVDQTGSNTDEISRISAEHPGEEGIVKGGRVLGIMVSRAFGDGFWKWDAELQKTLAKTYFNGLYPKMIPFEGLKTPPYLTAEPVVTTMKLELGKGKGSFLILASDGFWDHVSDEQAVRLVRAWVECRERDRDRDREPSEREAGKGEVGGNKGAKIDRIDEEMWKWHDGCLIVKDENVATHLVRNALGGSDEEFLRAMFAFEAPRTRNMRYVVVL
jgi:pyruvate dehydrogenase phosphatase